MCVGRTSISLICWLVTSLAAICSNFPTSEVSGARRTKTSSWLQKGVKSGQTWFGLDFLPHEATSLEHSPKAMPRPAFCSSVHGPVSISPDKALMPSQPIRWLPTLFNTDWYCVSLSCSNCSLDSRRSWLVKKVCSCRTSSFIRSSMAGFGIVPAGLSELTWCTRLQLNDTFQIT